MNTKYRIVRRACGWAVQQTAVPDFQRSITGNDWHTLRTWPFHFLAALHLLWLRERSRK